MIKIIKKKKNPNLQGEEFIDDHFTDLLFDSIVYNYNWKFQEALTYKNIGLNKCIDCSINGESHYYGDCDCENYLQDYNIENRGWITSKELITGVKKQFKYLSLPQLIKFRTKLININRKDNKIQIYEDDVKNLIKDINQIISKRK